MKKQIDVTFQIMPEVVFVISFIYQVRQLGQKKLLYNTYNGTELFSVPITYLIFTQSKVVHMLSHILIHGSLISDILTSRHF